MRDAVSARLRAPGLAPGHSDMPRALWCALVALIAAVGVVAAGMATADRAEARPIWITDPVLHPAVSSEPSDYLPQPGGKLTAEPMNMSDSLPGTIRNVYDWYTCPTAETELASCIHTAVSLSPTYTLTQNDVGSFIRVAVWACDPGDSTCAEGVSRGYGPIQSGEAPDPSPVTDLIPDPEDLPGDLLPPGNLVPSNDCITSPTTVVDGYFGSLYARLKTQGSGANTWVCARLQPENGTELAGGKLVVSDAGSGVSQDDKYGECSTQGGNVLPGPHPFRSGTIGDPDEPPSAPYLLDAYANGSGAAWLCLRAGIGARLMLNGGASVFKQDDPVLAVSPPRTPWTPGKASTDCESQTGGTKTRLVNALISGTQVWLTAWQLGSKVQLCVRAAGSTTAGGRLTIEAGASGVSPVLDQGTDTTACTTDVFTDDQDQLYVRRSSGTANPASVCITKGTTSQRFTVGFTASPSVTLPSWTTDS